VRATSCFQTIHPCVTHAETLSDDTDFPLKFTHELTHSIGLASLRCLESVGLAQGMDVKS
jgi:hypothetical protein